MALFFLVLGIEGNKEGWKERGVPMGIPKHCAGCWKGRNSVYIPVGVKTASANCRPHTPVAGQRRAFLIMGPATLHQWHPRGELRQLVALPRSHVVSPEGHLGPGLRGHGQVPCMTLAPARWE